MELAELAAAARVRTLVLTHLTEQIDQPGVRERVVAQMSRAYDGHIVIGEDGMELAVGGPPAVALK